MERSEELDLRLGSSGDRRRQKITIFYKGQVCVSDVTDLQARAILGLAEKEQTGDSKAMQIMNPGQSMKRSLQRFLQKRKARIADHSSPYAQQKLPLLHLFSA